MRHSFLSDTTHKTALTTNCAVMMRLTNVGSVLPTPSNLSKAAEVSAAVSMNRPKPITPINQKTT